MATPGLYYGQFIQHLKNNLQKISELEPTEIDQITAKFVRGVLEDTAQVLATQDSLKLISPPKKITIAPPAASKTATATLDIIQSVLSLHGMITVVENSVPNPSVRLELNQALNRCLNSITPALSNLKDVTSTSQQLVQSIVSIGKKLLAYEDYELPESIAPTKSSADKTASLLNQSDLTITAGLCRYAQQLNLSTEDQQLFSTLNAQVSEALRK